jgi:hypothetical protein
LVIEQYAFGVVNSGDTFFANQGFDSEEWHRFGLYPEDQFKLQGYAYFETDSIIITFKYRKREKLHKLEMAVDYIEEVQHTQGRVDFYLKDEYPGAGLPSKVILFADADNWKCYVETEYAVFFFSGLIF